METNNQNLPPVPSVPASAMVPSPPKLPMPPLPPEKTENVDYAEPGLKENQNRKWIIFAIVIVLIIISINAFAFMSAIHKDAQNIKVSGNQVTMKWKDIDLSAQLMPKETISFVTNGGQADSRSTGLFGVIPMDKVRYLEQKYKDIIHCGSAGEAETKSLEYTANLIANNASAENGLQSLDKLVKKGNWVEFKIDGSRMAQMQGSQSGKSFPIQSPSQLVFYLVDDVRIVQENYQ